MIGKEKMQEAEVSIRVALFYIRSRLTDQDVEVAIDGAQVKTSNTIHFHIKNFMKELGLVKEDNLTGDWHGSYLVEGFNARVIIHSYPGKGDVIIKQLNGRILYIESKKGNVLKGKVSTEYSLMREAIGQLITSENYNENVDLAVAVPKSDKSYELAVRWCRLQQMKNLGITFLLVEESGELSIV